MHILIIGQGLAGTMLSFRLQKHGHKITVIDNPQKNKASNAAAGLINPIIFRRLTKTWLADDLFPYFIKNTNELENFLGEQFFFPMPIYRLLNEHEFTFWKNKNLENHLSDYISPSAITNCFEHAPHLKTPYNYGKVIKAGKFKLDRLILKYLTHLNNTGAFIQDEFNYDDIQLKASSLIWKGQEFDKIIFCEGHYASNNPFFNSIKFKHTKGETLTIKAKNINMKNILSKNIFMMPHEKNSYKIGATYDWNELNMIPTKEAQDELTEKLESIINFTYSITEHKVGIRPTTHDRRPVIGLHPQHPQIGIFNGLGSKGLLLAPYFAEHFAKFISGNIENLNNEVDLKRYD